MRKLTQRALPKSLPGYPDYLAALLHARGITTPQQAEAYLSPSADQLHDPFLLKDMDKACALLKAAADQGQTVVVYGDYDADGVCASAILLDALHSLGLSAFSYIPTRLSEGYGLNAEAVKTLARQASLLLSVDCGITAHEEVALARELGLTVILTDHHTLPETLPPADAIIHPQLGGYPNPSLCGAGVAFKFACALLGFEKARENLDLAALATVADLVPLVGENRVLVSLGLEAMAGTRRLGLQALMRVSGIKEGTTVKAEHVAYQLAPRLNAGGRLTTAQDAMNLLTTASREEALNLAVMLDQLNRERREVEQQSLKEATAQLAGQDLSRRRSLVIFGENWNPGVVGLTAGKLAERWNMPCIALTRNGEELSGSGRGAGGIDLYAAIDACSSLLTRFGGHKMAAGLAMKPENLEAFREGFDQAVKAQLGEEDLVPEVVYDTTLPLQAVSLDTIKSLDRLAPFGLGNPAPVFLLENLSLVSAKAVGSDQSHLKLTVAQEGAVREGIAFSQGKALASLGKEISLVAAVDPNEFNGRVSPQLKVKALLPGDSPFAEDRAAQARAVCAALGHGILVDGETPAASLEQSLPLPIGTRGSLYLAYTHQAANAAYQRLGSVSTFVGSAADPRSFNALVYAPDPSLPFAAYRRLVFVDGVPSKAAVSLLAQAAKASEAIALPSDAALSGLMESLRPDLQELRDAYKALRLGQPAHPDPGKEMVYLAVFAQLGLVELDGRGRLVKLLPMKHIHPDQSPLYRAFTSKE